MRIGHFVRLFFCMGIQARSDPTKPLRRFPARHGLAIAWAGVEDHPPEPPCLGAVTALLGQNGEVVQGEVPVDPLVDATELVGTLESQDPPPAGFGLGRLARLAVQARLAEMQLGVIGADRGGYCEL